MYDTQMSTSNIYVLFTFLNILRTDLLFRSYLRHIHCNVTEHALNFLCRSAGKTVIENECSGCGYGMVFSQCEGDCHRYGTFIYVDLDHIFGGIFADKGLAYRTDTGGCQVFHAAHGIDLAHKRSHDSLHQVALQFY